MTRLLDGDMQLTLISVVPCLLQIAIEKRPKLARMTCKEKMQELTSKDTEHTNKLQALTTKDTEHDNKLQALTTKDSQHDN